MLHSPAFRRLEKKTQLFPGNESDFFRNRLTHSLEVAQIAKVIAMQINDSDEFKLKGLEVNPEICEIAGLMHDLGHPPFGHNGEMALDNCMKDFGGFEGNAQTIRIITRLEKKEFRNTIIFKNGKDNRVGLNLTSRVIASALKYDECIPTNRNEADGLVKGYYNSEKQIIEKLKTKILGKDYNISVPFKTIECSIMDVVDDIAYSTYDIEDAFKADFLSPYDIMTADDDIIDQILSKLKSDGINTTIGEIRAVLYGLFADVWQDIIEDQRQIGSNDKDYQNKTLSNMVTSYKWSKRVASDGYSRTKFTSFLVNMFVNGIEFRINEECPQLSKVYLNPETNLKVNILKRFAYIALINSSKLKVAEFRGRDIIKKIFDTLSTDEGYKLLPEDFQEIYFSIAAEEQNRIICDFIAGMTDRYALEFYCRLFSENPQTIFKPL